MTSVFSFMRRYMARYWAWYLGGILALVATNWLAVSIPVVLAEAIDQFARPQAAIGQKALLIALMGIGIILVRTASRILFFTPGRLIEAQLKDDVFARLLEQQPPFFRRFATGDLVSRFSSDISALRLLAGFAALQIVNVVAVLSLSLTQMARISPRLTTWMIAPLAVSLFINQLFIRKLFFLVKRMQVELGALSDHVLSSYEGIATVQSFTAEGAFIERFRGRNEAYMSTMLKRANLRTVVGPVLFLAIAINVFTLLFVGGPMAIRGEISVGELVAFTTLVALMASPARGVGFLFAIVKQSQASLERIEEVVLPEPDRPDREHHRSAPPRPPALELRDLEFSYSGSAQPVLRSVSLTLPAGTTLGILGPTGAGKSTLLRCIARLENPPAGRVFVDGVDVREIDLDAWRRAMVLVPQRAFLFSESLRDNILLGEGDERALQRVLRLAALEPDVEML
ncbi:MAG: ABC transporter ATP-binding protein, partial [Myxococcales bacterium]|nr:ABC transporter ATP-binding protein [Myxococcales bacterium]